MLLEVKEIFVQFHCLSSYQNDLFRNDFELKRPFSILTILFFVVKSVKMVPRVLYKLVQFASYYFIVYTNY